MAKRKGKAKYGFANLGEVCYERIVQRAQAARKEKLERLAERGIGSNDEEWEEGEDVPNQYDISPKALQSRPGSVPDEEEIAMRTRDIRKQWDKKTKEDRMGAYAPVSAELRSVSGMADIKNRARGVVDKN